jgi:hypothetical protein
MTQRLPRSARLDLIPLEGRTVPSTVTATTDTRPLVFELRGNITNDQTTGTDATQTTNHYDGVVTADGTLNYTSSTQGTSDTVHATGAGTGLVTVGSGPGASYSNTFSGDFTVKDDGGTWTTDKAFTGTLTQSGPDAKSTGTSDVGPFGGSGQFNVSDYTFAANWNGPNGKGSFSGSLSQPLASPTDLAFGDGSGEVTADGTVHVHFSVNVTGALMKAASEDAAATTVTAAWQGDPQKVGEGPQTADAGFTVPIAWNAGTLSVDVTGLTMPAWAKTLVLTVNADGKVAESNTGNNTLVISPTPQPVPVQNPPPSGGGTGTTDGSGGTTGGTGTTTPPPTGSGTPPPSSPPPTPAPTPATTSTGPTVVGFALSGDGRGHIQWRMSDGSVTGDVAPFGPGYSGPVNLGTGDMNGDGVLDAVVSAGFGGGPRVVVIDGKTKAEITSFFAYDPSFTGGVSLAVADVNGDGRPDIVTGAGQGGGPQVNVFGADGTYAYGFFAYDPSFRNGVRVTAGDLDGNGAAEIITGTNIGGGPVVEIFDGRTGVMVDLFLAGPADSRGGVDVSVTTDATGKASIVSKVGPDPGPVLTGPPAPSPLPLAITTGLGGPFAARPSGIMPNDPLLPG